MKKKEEYPLIQVLAVKKRRVEEAEKALRERKKELEAEETKLKKVIEERDKVLEHKNDKLAQLRQALDEGTTSTEIKQMKRYLEVVLENLAKEEEKVKEQELKVKEAKERVEEAETLLKQRRLEEDKIKEHRKHWEKEAKKRERIEEERRQDEVGSTMYISKKWGKK